MNLRFLSMLAALAVAGGASGQEPATVYKLRNVAAVDAVRAVNAFVTQKKLGLTVVAEPVTNSIFVSGDAGHQKQVVELFAAIDKEQPKVVLALMMVEVPGDFAETSGLGEGDKWVLSPRETRMLKAAIARDNGRGVTVLCEPKIVLTDNKTGFFRTSKQDLTIRATPRIAPKGEAILLRVEAQSTKSRTVPTVFCDKPMPITVLDTQTSETTESIPEGSTLLMRAVRSKTETETRDMFVLVNTAILK